MQDNPSHLRSSNRRHSDGNAATDLRRVPYGLATGLATADRSSVIHLGHECRRAIGRGRSRYCFSTWINTLAADRNVHRVTSG